MWFIHSKITEQHTNKPGQSRGKYGATTVAKVAETSYLNERKLFTALSRVIFLPSPPAPSFPMLLAIQYDVQNLDGQG